jgi:uncharacterized protein (PEP-CTERM system associated)
MLWQITPFTTASASYTNSITSSQGNILNNTAGLFLGGGGLGLASNLNGPGQFTAGIPFTGTNAGIYQNNIFRMKLFSGNVSSNLFGQTIGFSAYHMERMSLIGATTGDLTAQGVQLSWLRNFTPDLVGHAWIGYHLDDLNRGKTWYINASLSYTLLPSVSGYLQYDYWQRDTALGPGGFAVNAITVGLRKTFE